MALKGPKLFRRLRETKGYTQAQLARIFKTTIRTISRWETGERAVSIHRVDCAERFKTETEELTR